MSKLLRTRGWLAAAVLFLAPATGAALSNPNDFCTGDPCVISSTKTADSGITLDFGSRTVVLSEILTIGDDPVTGYVGSLTILAGNFHIIGNGQIKGNGGPEPAGWITIETTGNIQIDGTRATGAFRLPGSDGGSVFLTAGGNVTGAGRFNLQKDSLIAAGGQLVISATGSVDLSGNIDADGAAQGFGGTVEIAAGNITLGGVIDISGGESGGGSLDLFSEGDITLGQLDISAGGEFGDAGIGDILALGNLNLNGIVSGSGADNGELCGDAADIDMTADGDINVNAAMTMRGRGRDCSGGFLSIDGNAVTIAAQIDLSATGTEGTGGDIDITSVAPMQIAARVRVDGPDGAGDVFITSDTDITIGGDILANGYGTFGSGASLLEIDASGAIVIDGDIIASGGGQGAGGDVSLDGCSVLQTPSSVIDARAAGGLIGVTASDELILQGTFFGEPTSPQAIDIIYGPAAAPPDIGAATFNVPPTLSENPLLTPCALCASNAECDDLNPCTNDTCIPSTGCTYTLANLAPCDDGNACTDDDFCAFGLCVSTTPLVCDDGDVCTDDSCDPQLGCQTTANSAPCDDADACTENDTCSAGVCAGTAIDCEDGNPCTDDACIAGACQSTDNSAPCDDGDACTLGDVCSGGTCQGGSPPDCTDGDPCTTDACESASGCVNDPIVGCADSDGDGILDDEDVCTTLDWTASPQSPPNQQPSKMRLVLKKLASPAGEQAALLKGFFNVAEPAQPIAPELDGIHFALSDDAGVFYEIDIPGGAAGDAANCDPRDGWKVVLGAKSQWKYSNRSGALPPACIPGSARGLAGVQIKDLRSSGKAALQAKVKVKNGTVDRLPSQPLQRIQADLVLAARPAAGVASAAAIGGQCAEAVISGSPISGSAPKPFCKQKVRGATLDKLNCKGE
jgi:hypothetical protein